MTRLIPGLKGEKKWHMRPITLALTPTMVESLVVKDRNSELCCLSEVKYDYLCLDSALCLLCVKPLEPYEPE